MVIPTKSQHIYLWSEATFVFGTENKWSQKNCEGWLAGVWDGNSWDGSQHIWGLEWSSQQNPNWLNIGRCSTKLPHHVYIFISSSSLELLLRNANRLVGGWRWMETTSEECFVFQLLIPFPIHLQQASRTLFSSSSDKDEFWEISSEAREWRINSQSLEDTQVGYTSH